MLRSYKTILAGIFLFGFSSLSQAAYVTGLSDTQIQNVLENYFPLNEYAAFARVSLYKPKVQLQDGSKGVILIIPVVANVAGGEVRRGHVTVLVNLTYKPLTGGIFFTQPKIQQFEISGVDETMLADLRVIVKSMGENSLPVVRIYAVKERDLNHSLAKSTLKSSVIENGRLRLEFGFK